MLPSSRTSITLVVSIEIELLGKKLYQKNAWKNWLLLKKTILEFNIGDFSGRLSRVNKIIFWLLFVSIARNIAHL